MEDDDEFGDLYTDVLPPFSSSSSSSVPPPQHQDKDRLPIDLNLGKAADRTNNDADNNDDDDEILYGAAGERRNLAALPPQPPPPSNRTVPDPADKNLGGGARVFGSSGAKLTGDLGGFQSGEPDKDVNFDIEEEGNNEIAPASGPVIPGLDDSGRNQAAAGVSKGGGGRGDWGDGDEEEDSDSEDDLQIVLNDNHHHGPMGMMGDAGDEDDDDEDGDPLVIVADVDPNIQGMEEQDWGGMGGEDATTGAGTGAEGEKKEGGDAATGKGNAVAIAPKLGYSNHAYHPFHSQFKYVRPGVTPTPGVPTVGPGGAPGQVRPPITLAGRGRGEWRPPGMKGGPPLQKGFHPGLGVSGWGGRGFGGGLEFTLPSHKTIFDVDVDSFEEKPWKYPGVDVSDFFNFGFNEESWKDYCKQLEQHRLETTMQSKIRVYESGRADQEYDPDLPPELAAAAGIHDMQADNNVGKSDVGKNDLTKGSDRVRPPLPNGRAIQVETGYGERLPSIDTRPPRMRDSDAIIEIIPQDSLDDDSPAVLDGATDNLPRDDFRGSHAAGGDKMQIETGYSDNFQHPYDGRKGGKKIPYMDSVHDNEPEVDRVMPFHPEAPGQYHSGSRGQPQMQHGGDFGTSHEERWTQGRRRGRSPHLTPLQSTRDNKFHGNVDEESGESMDNKHSPLGLSPTAVRPARELTAECKDVSVPGELAPAEESLRMDKDEMTDNEETTNDSVKDGNMLRSSKKQKVNSHVEQPELQDLDDGEDSKAGRSSENSKGRSGSSKGYQKWQDDIDEEVVQDGRLTHMGSVKRHHDENAQNFRRKDQHVRQEMEKHHMPIKGREDSFSHRDSDPSSYDRRKEREIRDGTFLLREEEPHSRKNRTEDSKKRERGDDMGSRHRTKIREGERSDKEEHLHSRRQLENSSYRVHYEKDGSSRNREREDSLKGRYEIGDDYYSKRRKDEEYLRRDYADKEEILHGYRETSSRLTRRRERDEGLDKRKRDDQLRIRDNLDDYHSVRHKDDVWLQRDRGERQREREELYRLKQSSEENLSKREREERRGSVRSGRGADEKSLMGHLRTKDEYKGMEKDYQDKEVLRNSEQHKRKDRMEDESFSHHRARDDVYARGNQFSSEERRSRQERTSTRSERTTDNAENQRAPEKRHKESMRKSEGGEHSTSGSSRRNQEGQTGNTDQMGLKGNGVQGNAEMEIPLQRNSSKRNREEASSDDEQQDSRRGRSKLERWTSHKERDYSISSKSAASLKFKEIDRNNNGGSSETSKLLEEPTKRVEPVENHPLPEDNNAGEPENKDTDSKPLEDRHLDTVEKLKKRSERFKLPMPIEKDASVIKKMESEALTSDKTETAADSEIKPARPARKRRWIGNQN